MPPNESIPLYKYTVLYAVWHAFDLQLDFDIIMLTERLQEGTVTLFALCLLLLLSSSWLVPAPLRRLALSLQCHCSNTSSCLRLLLREKGKKQVAQNRKTHTHAWMHTDTHIGITLLGLESEFEWHCDEGPQGRLRGHENQRDGTDATGAECCTKGKPHLLTLSTMAIH